MSINKKWFNEFISWGCENEENRQEAIHAACFLIATLNQKMACKGLSDKDLKEMYAGYTTQVQAQSTKKEQSGVLPPTFGSITGGSDF